MISTPAKLRSIYLGLLAWCTLWWEGIENPLQPAELAHHLGMDEELKAQAEQHGGDHRLGRGKPMRIMGIQNSHMPGDGGTSDSGERRWRG